MSSLKIYLAVVVCTLTTPVYAEWSLEQARQAAFVRDAQLQWYQREQAIVAAKSMFAGQPDNPTISTNLENFGNSQLKQLDGPSLSVQYSQTWTRPTTLALRQQLADRAEQQRQLQIRQRQAEVSAEVRLCLAEWTAAYQQQQLLNEDLQVAQRQTKYTQERLRAGRTIESEYQRLAALEVEAQSLLTLQHSVVEYQKASCTLLMGELPETPPNLPLILGSLPEVSLAQELAVFEQHTRQQQAALVQAEKKPDLTWSVGVKSFTQTGDAALMFGASVPLQRIDHHQVLRVEADQQLQYAQQQIPRQQQLSIHQLRQVQGEYHHLQNLLGVLDQQVIPSSTQSLQIAQRAYQAGKIDLLAWLEIRRGWREAQERRIQTQLKIHRVIANLERQFDTLNVH